ncbi:MAG: hypothetical protein C0494_15785 [Sphingobium sp.]|nr:hypothetical protein [Sphingobium sp.]
MAMLTTKKLSPESVYADLMEDLKVRLDFLREMLGAIADQVDEPRAYLKAESCFLQVRYICELVALSSLCANERFGLTARLLKSWHAGEILADLTRINPVCFPRAVDVIRENDAISVEVVHQQPLTQEALVSMYNKCGSVLHRGMLKHIIKGDDRLYNLEEVNGWARQLVQLLASHVALVPHGNRVLLVNMNFGGPGPVAVATADGVVGDAFVLRICKASRRHLLKPNRAPCLLCDC